MNRPGLAIGWALAAGRKQKKNEKVCAVCGKAFQRRGNRQSQKFHCSIECKAKSQVGKLINGFNKKEKRGPIKTCATCGKAFQRPPSQQSDYCSLRCSMAKPGRFAAISGSRHYNWKGGITPHNVTLRKNADSRAWTLAVFRRDGFKCRACGQSRDLQAHHKLPWAEFQSMRWNVENGITLCRKHHNFIHWFGRHLGTKISKIMARNNIDGGHWYTTAGVPMYTVPKKDGSGERPTTLADAKKLNLLPSVTQVLKILDKPALRDWLVRQAVMAVCTAPDIPGEGLDAKISRVLDVEVQQDQEAQAARDRGTEIHAGLEAMFAGVPVAPDLFPWVHPVYQAMAHRGEVMGIEKIIVGDGYAGKLDLQLQAPDETMWLFDYKTTKRLPEKTAWPEAKMQLAAYAKALYDFGITPIRVCVVYISTLKPGEFRTFEDIEWQTEYENGFSPLHKAWMHLNRYVPSSMD